MADFRRWILALTVLALCVAGASAQVGLPTGGLNNNPFSCTANTATVTPTVRAEGITELTGDIVLNCTGGAALPAGAQIPQANITVFLNTTITSRLLGNGTGQASETVLMIDEPNSGLTGAGPALPFIFCATPQSGCAAYAGANGSMVTLPGGAVTAPNIYQGVVSGIDSKSVTFNGVPILPPASNGVTRVYRITNMRANAQAIPAGATTPGYVSAFVSINGSSYVPIVNSQLVVGYVSTGLTTSLRNTGNSGGLSTGSKQFNQCTNYTNGGAETPVAVLRYSSNFGTAFKTRVLAGTGGNSGTNASGAIQNVPGSPANAGSESGFIFNGAPMAFEGNAASTTLTGTQGAIAGLADFGTRFRAVFSNIPAGVSIYLSTVNLAGSTATPAVAPPITSTTTTFAQLIVSSTASENLLGGAPTLSATGSNGTSFAVFTPASGSNTVEGDWEVINSNINQTQNFDFGVWVGWSPNVATNTPAAPTTITVSMSYAPISTSFKATSGDPIPRFVDLGTGDNQTIIQINICTTNLLFPYITTITGFDTGLAISNTSMDPFGTTNQAGACTLYWYGNNNGGTTNTPIPNSTTATTAAPTIVAGTTWVNVASASNMAGQGFTGYMIATCNFQYAHGYAAVTDIGSRGILTAYLALIINGTRGTAAAAETLTH